MVLPLPHLFPHSVCTLCLPPTDLMCADHHHHPEPGHLPGCLMCGLIAGQDQNVGTCQLHSFVMMQNVHYHVFSIPPPLPPIHSFLGVWYIFFGAPQKKVTPSTPVIFVFVHHCCILTMTIINLRRTYSAYSPPPYVAIILTDRQCKVLSGRVSFL